MNTMERARRNVADNNQSQRSYCKMGTEGYITPKTALKNFKTNINEENIPYSEFNDYSGCSFYNNLKTEKLIEIV